MFLKMIIGNHFLLNLKAFILNIECRLWSHQNLRGCCKDIINELMIYESILASFQ